MEYINAITSKDDLKLICNKYSFKYDELLSNKNKFDFYKIFIDLNTYRMFAYILNKNKRFPEPIASCVSSDQ